MSLAGLLACEEAFERLKKGKPNIAGHVDLDRSRVTAGIVSVEAGFDRGYLKKSRVNHLPLLARITSYRESKVGNEDDLSNRFRRASSKIHRLEGELEVCRSMMYKVLSQNIQLVETIRRLEQFVKDAEVKT